MGYKKKTIEGLSWIGLLRGTTRVVMILRTAYLARILNPAQFGFFGIATLVLAFLEILTETGINIFLIQEKKDVKDYLNAAWVISIIRGVLLMVAILVLTPLILLFFKSPEALPLILFISLVPLIRGFINPAIVTFQKELYFKKEFYLRLAIYLIDSLVVVLVAATTKSAMSFVWGLVIGALCEVILSFVFIKPRPRLAFEIPKIKHIVGRGKWVTLIGIFSYIAQEGDNVVVGRILGASPLGIYQMAYKFSTLPLSEITDVANKVVFPVYAKIADSKERLLKAFIKIFSISTALALIFGMLLYILADPIVHLLLGDKWLSVIPIIKVLSFYGVLRAIFGTFSPVFLAVGKQDFVARMTFIRVVTLLLSIFPLIATFGLIGAGYAAILSIIAEIPIVLYFSYRIFRT